MNKDILYLIEDLIEDLEKIKNLEDKEYKLYLTEQNYDYTKIDLESGVVTYVLDDEEDIISFSDIDDDDQLAILLELSNQIKEGNIN